MKNDYFFFLSKFQKFLNIILFNFLPSKRTSGGRQAVH
jgi:hypothetical protein